MSNIHSYNATTIACNGRMIMDTFVKVDKDVEEFSKTFSNAIKKECPFNKWPKMCEDKLFLVQFQSKF
jgi:hypothetical protein